MNLSSHLAAAAALIQQTATPDLEAVVEAAITAVSDALRNNHPLLVCGNGGSATDAMHITGELVGRFLKERRALKAICLSSNTAVLTAWSNDYEYATAFARQVEAYAEPGGVLLGISTSGNSANVVNALETARAAGMTTVGLTGAGGGRMADLCDHLIAVPSRRTPDIQQVHLCLYHYMCEMIEARCA